MIIIKWIGIILAGLLLLFLVLCLLFLFVPVRYQIVIDTKSKIPVNIRMRFLFPLFSARMRVLEKKPQFFVKVFGIKILDLDRKRKRAKNKKKQKSRKQTRRKGNKSTLSVLDRKEDVHGISAKKESLAGELKIAETSQIEGEVQKSERHKEEGKVARFLQKVKEKIQKIKETFYKFCDIIKKYMEKLENMGKTPEEEEGIWDSLKEKFAMGKELWEAEESKVFFKLSKEQFGILLRHIRPRKAKGYIRFGTGDPCFTGELLGVLAFALPLYGDYVQIIPEFERTCLEAEWKGKGRIQMYLLLRFFLRWYLADERKNWEKKRKEIMV